jgi:hypothetical protein
VHHLGHVGGDHGVSRSLRVEVPGEAGCRVAAKKIPTKLKLIKLLSTELQNVKKKIVNARNKMHPL